MKRLKKIITLYIFLTFAAGVGCTTETYTLKQCVDMALANSKEALNARNNTEMATALRKEAFTKYFPEISAVGMVFWANHDILQYNVLDIIELGIIKNGKTAGIQAMQPVFLGGQIVNGNKLAEVGEEVARIRSTQTDNDLRLNTESIFWKLAALQATRATLESAIATLDTLEAQVRVAVDAGLVLRNDLLKVQLKRNSFRSEMVDLDNGIKLVKMLLAQYIGLGTDGDIDIDAELPSKAPSFPSDLFVEPNVALGTMPDYMLLQKNIEAKRLEKRMEIGKNLPAVAVGAGWYYHDLLKQDHNFGAIQIGVAVPLSGWWGGSYAIKRKSLALDNAINERDDLTQKLVIEIQDKWNNVTAAYRKMEIETENIAENEENTRLNSLYYEAGMSTVGDLLEAETMLKEAREKYIAAYGSFRTAVAEYLITTNRPTY